MIMKKMIAARAEHDNVREKLLRQAEAQVEQAKSIHVIADPAQKKQAQAAALAERAAQRKLEAMQLEADVERLREEAAELERQREEARRAEELRQRTAEQVQRAVESCPGEIDNGESETKEINPLVITCLSPEGACEHYSLIKLNTMLNVAAKINRQLARSVADHDQIVIDEEKILPDEETDTLCIWNEQLRDELLDTFREKGWNVRVDTAPLGGKTLYVFEPTEKTDDDQEVIG